MKSHCEQVVNWSPVQISSQVVHDLPPNGGRVPQVWQLWSLVK